MLWQPIKKAYCSPDVLEYIDKNFTKNQVLLGVFDHEEEFPDYWIYYCKIMPNFSKTTQEKWQKMKVVGLKVPKEPIHVVRVQNPITDFEKSLPVSWFLMELASNEFYLCCEFMYFGNQVVPMPMSNDTLRLVKRTFDVCFGMNQIRQHLPYELDKFENW